MEWSGDIIQISYEQIADSKNTIPTDNTAFCRIISLKLTGKQPNNEKREKTYDRRNYLKKYESRMPQ